MALQGSCLVLQAGMMTLFPLFSAMLSPHTLCSIFSESSAPHRGPTWFLCLECSLSTTAPNFLWQINTYTFFTVQHKRFIFQAAFLDFPTLLVFLWMYLDCTWLHVTKEMRWWCLKLHRQWSSEITAAASSPTRYPTKDMGFFHLLLCCP